MNTELKFTVCTELTESDYVRFYRFDTWHKKNTKWAVICFVMATAVFYLRDILFNRFPSIGIGFTVGTLYLIWMYTKGADKRALKFYHENKLGGKSEVHFYDDTLEIVGDTTRSEWQYKELVEIIATKGDLYIKYSPVFTLCIKKADCPEGFLEFMNSLKQQYGI